MPRPERAARSVAHPSPRERRALVVAYGAAAVVASIACWAFLGDPPVAVVLVAVGGAFLSASTLGVVVFRIARRYGRRPLCAFGGAVWSAVKLLFSFP